MTLNEPRIKSPMAVLTESEFLRVMTNDSVARYCYDLARSNGLDEVTTLKCVIVQLSDALRLK